MPDQPAATPGASTTTPASEARRLLDDAAGLPSLLDAACELFSYILTALRAAEDRAGGMFAAFVMAAAAAASGRDAITAAPSLPSAARPPLRPPPGTPDAVADHAAELAGLLQSRLAAAHEAGPADLDAADRAATCASRIQQLLTRADDR